MRSSVIVGVRRGGGHDRALDPQRLRLRHDAVPRRATLFYLLLFGMILPFEAVVVPLYYDLRAVGLDEHLLVGGPPAARLNVCVRHVLDARVLPHGAASR